MKVAHRTLQSGEVRTAYYPVTPNPEWAAMVREVRKKRHLPEYVLAESVGLDGSYLSLMEVHGYVPSLEKVRAIISALDLPEDEALLVAGYAPRRISNWAAVLASTDFAGGRGLPEELALALRDAATLDAEGQQNVAGFLAGLCQDLHVRRA